MRRSEPFHDQLQALMGDATLAQPILWFSSILVGIVLCRTVYNVLKVLSPVYSKGYCKLSKLQQVEWDNRGFSTAHAFLVTAVSTYLLFVIGFFKDNVSDGPVVFRSSLLSQTILGVSIGYFISDLAMIIWFHPALGGIEYVLHHLLSIISLSLSLYSGQAHFYIYLVLFSEITTPLVNLRWYLNAAGLKSSKAYVINGVLLFFGWLIARILLFVYFFWHMYTHFDQVRQIFTAGLYFLFIAPPCLALMNLFWFYKVARGLVRTLLKRS